MERITRKKLAIILSKLKVFNTPKVMLEQYPTDSEIASIVLWNAFTKGDLTGKVSADFGCGTGILSIGMMILGSKKVYMVDLDKDAIKVAKENLKDIRSEYDLSTETVFINKDIADFNEKCDVIIENPPFGVKNKHADRPFLEKAFDSANIIYSIHKSESKNFIKRTSEKKGFEVTDIWNYKFPIKSSYKFHTKRIKYIEVSCFRIEKRLHSKKKTI